jgi:hypothetical protein
MRGVGERGAESAGGRRLWVNGERGGVGVRGAWLDDADARPDDTAGGGCSGE